MTRADLTHAERAQLNELGFVRKSSADDDRDAALLALRAELVAVQAKVLAAHRRVANLIDAVQAMETAIADVDFERERE